MFSCVLRAMVSCRQLSRHLLALWMEKNVVGDNLLGRILVSSRGRGFKLLLWMPFCQWLRGHPAAGRLARRTSIFRGRPGKGH
jgi:hypothetical protein